MPYNTDRRPRYSKKFREAFLLEEGCRCYWCGQPILPGQPWAIEHKTARELLPPGGEADARANLAAIHAHPATCHKEKTALDIAIIAKSNRIRRAHGPIEQRKHKKPLKSQGFQKGPSQKIQSAGFQKGSRPIPSRQFPKRRT
jgi:hypothetical protein